MNKIKPEPETKVFELDALNWDSDLHEFTHSLFLTVEWIESLRSKIYHPIYLDFRCNDITIGKLSGIISKETWLKGKQLYGFASPAMKSADQGVYDQCMKTLVDFARTRKISRVILGSYDQQHSMKCQVKEYHITNRSEYIVRFRDEIPLDTSKGFRKNAGKAKKSGAIFDSSHEPEMLKELLNLINYTRNHRELKHGNVYDPFYLKGMTPETLLKLMQTGLGVIHHARDADGKVHCAQLNIKKNRHSYGLLMGSNQYAYQNGYPSFVDFNIIEKARNNGYLYYNPGGNANDHHGAGLEKYKLSMGATRFDFHGATTNFLQGPRKLLNPLMNAGRLLCPSSKGIFGVLKKHV